MGGLGIVSIRTCYKRGGWGGGGRAGKVGGGWERLGGEGGGYKAPQGSSHTNPIKMMVKRFLPSIKMTVKRYHP